ncbi:MAG: hypothetical protein R3B81_03625 [bacterium]
MTEPRASLPFLYGRWIGALVDGPIPAETHATCAECAMCRPAEARLPSRIYFEPETKCCTYLPELPNYLVGGVLTDPHTHPHGRASLEVRIDAGVRVTPLGVGIPGPIELLLRNESGAFGRARGLRCPHYVADQGLCGIRDHCGAACTTYFCKHVRGAAGFEFWEAVKELLFAAQRTLSLWCVGEVGLEDTVVESLLRHEPASVDAAAIDESETEARRCATWGSWRGREREFYRECAERVAPMEWSDVRRLGGAELELHERVVKMRWQRLTSPDIPRRLRALPHEVVSRGPKTVTVNSYRGTDPLELTRGLYDLLPAFDGRPTDEVIAGIARERGFPPARDHLRELWDFRLLGEDDGLRASDR